MLNCGFVFGEKSNGLKVAEGRLKGACVGMFTGR